MARDCRRQSACSTGAGCLTACIARIAVALQPIRVPFTSTATRPLRFSQEMYYRHLYARCNPDLRQRCESWDNYCDLFGLLLHSNVNMQLPNQWIWDMVDEFIYQFQSFCQYRAKVSQKSPEELELLKKCEKVCQGRGGCGCEGGVDEAVWVGRVCVGRVRRGGVQQEV
eukprot:365319-Chlamydomonas_euryale.AAC.2